MAAVAKISLRAKLEDLGIPQEIISQFSTVPTETQYSYLVQTTTDVGQVLNLGGVTTVQGIIILAKANDLAVDTSYNAVFSEEITIAEGQFSVFVPKGTVYVKNSVALEVCTFEYLILGT